MQSGAGGATLSSEAIDKQDNFLAKAPKVTFPWARACPGSDA